jgi:Co/Zn/Cd efflux system component
VGGPRTIDDEAQHMSSARAFDTLVEANLMLVQSSDRLVKGIRGATIVMCAVGVLATVLTCLSAYMLHAGQLETHEMVRTILKTNCGDRLTTKE